MLKFTKLSETSVKIIYNIFNGKSGRIEYLKENEDILYFNEQGIKEDIDPFFKTAFLKVKENNFPREYTYAIC